MTRPFHIVLVANRGEIARRIIRTLRRLGIRSVAVYSDADSDAPHVADADSAVRIGPPAAAASYLRTEAIVEAALASGADAVHPGYGFLSENVELARACAAAGIVFVGPGERALTVMGDKIRAREHVAVHGVPIVAGASLAGVSDAEARGLAEGIGYPLLVKPSAGGGGKGMEVVHSSSELEHALTAARRVARAAFGDDTLLLERLILAPRHIEVQVLADDAGTVVHLGERECTLQRRHQKVVEEAPSIVVDDEVRERLGTAACAAAASVDYRGAGTVEFLVPAADPGAFSFIEMNTRLQVEHPVTEMVTGLDLVEQQLRIAAGEPLAFAQTDVTLRGHAIEARVYAESPHRGFLPSTGRVLAWKPAAGVRTDSGVETDTTVTADYDPMIAKVIAHAPTRAEAIARLDAALGETVVLGVETNVSFLRTILRDESVIAGDLDTDLLARIPVPAPTAPSRGMIAAAADALPRPAVHARAPWTAADGWRAGTPPHTPRPAEFVLDGVDDPLLADGAPSAGAVAAVDERGDVWVFDAGVTVALTPVSRRTRTLRALTAAAGGDAGAVLAAPLPGTVVALHAEDGATVTAGQRILTIEAMKMEHALVAARDGVLRLEVGPGSVVARDQVVAVIHDADTPEENA